MTTIEIKVPRMVRKKIDVTFPAFFKAGDVSDHSDGSWDAVYRLDEDGTLWSITKRDRALFESEVQYEIARELIGDFASWFAPEPDGFSPRRPAAAADFAEMLAEMQAFLSSAPA